MILSNKFYTKIRINRSPKQNFELGVVSGVPGNIWQPPYSTFPGQTVCHVFYDIRVK